MCGTGHADLSRRCRNTRRLLGLVAAGVLAAAPSAASTAVPPLSLGAMLRAVAEGSNAAVTGELEMAQAQAATDEIRASYWPTVELEGGYTVRDSPIVAIFGDFAAPMGTGTFWQAQLRARELLWDGGVRSRAVEAGEHTVAAASAGRDAHIVMAQMEGMGAYLQAVLAQARRGVVEQRVTALRAHLGDAENLYAQGMVARNDLLETSVRLRVVEDQLPKLEDGVAIAVQDINRLMGRDPSTPLSVPGGLAAPPPLPAPKGTLLDEATEHNPELVALRARLDAARSRQEATARENYPKLVLSAAHTYEENPYLLHNNANVAMLGLSWKLYDGGARKRRTTSVCYEAEKIGHELEETRRRLETRFDQAYRRYQQSLREAATARENVGAAAENLRIVTDQYRAGLARGSDVLDAESLLSSARFTLAERHLAAYLQQATVLAIAGRDLPAFYDTIGAVPAEVRHE